MRILVTGTDTDVGKTRVTAHVAAALRVAGRAPLVVKLVQTGVAPGEPGDAERAGLAAGCAYREIARFERATDPWSAALSAGRSPLTVLELCRGLPPPPRSIVVEGSGGLAVPLNSGESFTDVARAAKLEVILTVGLRLGCINHALLTLAACARAGIAVAGAVLVDRWNLQDADYRGDVVRILGATTRILDEFPYSTENAPLDGRLTRSLRLMHGEHLR